MPHVLFLFLDGVGLGLNDPNQNPFASAQLPTLRQLMGGAGLLADTPALTTDQASFRPLDAQMDVPGLPQSASGQASILTGRNVPAELGKHWGPKPNAAIREIVQADNLFKQLKAKGRQVALANAYPPGYFAVTNSGRRLHGTIPTAYLAAEQPLYDVDDLMAGRGFSADWTGEGWRTQLNVPNAPIYSPFEAGQRLAHQTQTVDLMFFDHWVTDYVGHRGTLENGVALLETFDQVLAGVVDQWNMAEDLIVITSDHGNLEDFSDSHHTDNRVPGILIGGPHAEIAPQLDRLSDIASPLINLLAH